MPTVSCTGDPNTENLDFLKKMLDTASLDKKALYTQKRQLISDTDLKQREFNT